MSLCTTETKLEKREKEEPVRREIPGAALIFNTAHDIFDCKLIDETFCQNFPFILWACNLHFILMHSMENVNVVPGKWATTSFHIVYKSGDYNQMQKQCGSPDSEASTLPYKSFCSGMDSK